MPVVHQLFDELGISQNNIDFTCSGSCDYLQGAAFAFVEGLSAIQTNPPIKESHVEMDAAWAMYESMLKIQILFHQLLYLLNLQENHSGKY